MKVVLISMPDVVPLVIHESAVHTPSHGIACIGGNIDTEHDVYLIDLVRKRRSIRKYLTRTLNRIQPDLVGLSAMAWQYDTCVKVARLVRSLCPQAKIVLGGYHATLMAEEIAVSPEAEVIDFIVRGEGEEACRRLVNALAGKDRFEAILSLSYKRNGKFVHNERSAPLDLSLLKPPIRDKRRLTWGYHMMYSRIELLETSRGCTRTCNFCSMKHMYGRTFRAFPIERVLADLDEIYDTCRTRWVFVIDDNMVLDPDRVIRLCDAIIARKYHNLHLIVQADCVSMSRNPEMVRKMAQAGFRIVFLGIENVSQKNLIAAHKGDIVSASEEAVALCHRYGIMVIAGMIFGFPEDDEQAIIDNYQFLNTVEADANICQILTPYLKTGMREDLIKKGLVVNQTDYKKYNGQWANVRTHHLTADRLQYLFWYHRQKVLGWWNPSRRVRDQGRGWTAIWNYVFKPVLRLYYDYVLRKYGWEGRHKREMERLSRMNRFPDLETF